MDPDWLSHLVYQLERSGAAAVGGPNLTPPDGWLAACVAASPGQPVHVLESDQVAEHIPGCNMAFRREVLEAINGFDPEYRKAGDDVDVCWRLQQAGYWITIAPGAFVWHHRRQNPRAYLKQQAGYGEAEALLQFKHPERFNGRGDEGAASCTGRRCKVAAVARQFIAARRIVSNVYQAGPALGDAARRARMAFHARPVAMAGFFWWPAWIVAGVMRWQATLPPDTKDSVHGCSSRGYVMRSRSFSPGPVIARGSFVSCARQRGAQANRRSG